MSAALKNKYIVRSRHSVLCNDRHVPVNREEAKDMVRKPCLHDNGPDPKNVDHEISVAMRQSVHGASNFIFTSPVSQDIFRAHPGITLDKDTIFSNYVPPVKSHPAGPLEKNPRLMALENFREISRIMTKNFLANKKLEARFGKASGTMPKNERDKKRVEDEAQ